MKSGETSARWALSADVLISVLCVHVIRNRRAHSGQCRACHAWRGDCAEDRGACGTPGAGRTHLAPRLPASPPLPSSEKGTSLPLSTLSRSVGCCPSLNDIEFITLVVSGGGHFHLFVDLIDGL